MRGVVINTKLDTKNGRVFGNALVIGKRSGKYVVRFDLGHKAELSGRQIAEYFFVGPIAGPEHKWYVRGVLQEVKSERVVKDGLVMPEVVRPYWDLVGQSLTLKVNYSFHFGVKEDEVVERLGITHKIYIDLIWLYENKGYKEKVMEFLHKEEQKRVNLERYGNKPVPFDELVDCSLTFKVNYAIYHGVGKEEIMSKLGIGNKTYIDLAWKYDGDGYKRRIEEYLRVNMVA